MVLLAANTGLRIVGRPQFLVFVIPCVRKNNEILCLKDREYSSSVPVRYVPKKFSRVKDSIGGFSRKGLEKNEPTKDLDASNELRTEVVKNGGRRVKGSVVFDDKFQNRHRIEVSSKNNIYFDDDVKQVEKLRNQNHNDISSKNKLKEDAEQVEKFQKQYQNEISSKKNPSFEDDAKQVEKLQNRNQNELSSKKNLLFEDDAKKVEKLQNGNRNEIPSKNNLLFDDDAKQEVAEEINCDSRVAELGLMEEHEEVIEEPEESFEQMKIAGQSDIFKQKVSLAGTNMQDAENLAIKLLARRAFTVVELRKKLNGKNFPADIIEAVLKDFQSRGLINDSLYAETYSRSRWSSSSWGPRRIKQALFNKGVSNTDAEKAVKLVFNDDESDDGLESKLGMSKPSMDHLFVQASKQWLRNRDAPKETRKVRIIRWLQYRGFNWGVTNFIVKKLESQ